MRDQLLEYLKKELIGPDPIPPHIQSNGEEILINEPPRLRYSTGILFPQGARVEERDKTDKDEQETLETLLGEEGTELSSDDSGDSTNSSVDPNDGVDSTDEMLNLANAYLPSAMGFSCFLNVPEQGFKMKVKAGRYYVGEYTYENQKGKVKPLRAYYRKPLEKEILIPKDDLPTLENRCCEISMDDEQNSDGEVEPCLVLNIRNRTPQSKFGAKDQLYTFSLINKIKSGKTILNEDCYFQVEFSVCSVDESPCFLPYPEKQSRSHDEDERSNRLLYRHRKNYAVGHGCAIDWKMNEKNEVIQISTSIIPTYEIKPIVPSSFSDLKLSMYEFSDFGDTKAALTSLQLLCDKYESWIKDQEKTASTLTEEFKESAERHIANCRQCLVRMRDGIQLLKESQNVRRAFNLMNRAMLIQQLHYNLPLRKWEFDKEDKDWKIPDAVLPDIHTPSTWPDWDERLKENTWLGQWRPFQVAFILLNLKSMALPQDHERKIVDLIWFPTGGGKTEAYLGLTAYTIFLKRLRDKTDDGTTVLMRYTLRLLTAQQYQRAAALIAACDLIRRKHEDELGKERITIGLWAGEGLTPNKRDDAVRKYKALYGGQSFENPFVILKCPWCGTQMGQIGERDQTRVKGYFQKRKPSTVIFKCDNSKCDFSNLDYSLPLKVIDEDIYESPPTLIIGTVDKFAILPWKSEAKRIFGFRDNCVRKTPPELIIQDELHLISGPLGSMVGHYETLISELCKNLDTGIGAKIIASTATISRAREQCHALYNCGKENVFQFPPQSLEAGDSFFAYEDKEAQGRLYTGVYPASGISHAMAQIRVISALLQGAKSSSVDDENERNYYWTILNYFNSLRELGHAATLISADIREYLNAMWIRKGIRKTDDNDPRRFINRHIELTSRIPSSQIPQLLQALEINYPSKDNFPVDICLATNMISVGVDVQRLGLMTVVGQPKTTSEYIQATSRVGRSKRGPGLVVVIFNAQKPRDRSHYEHFRFYHARIYSQVEPTSVTPFSAPVRERALHAILVGFVRLFFPQHQDSPQPFPNEEVVKQLREIIRRRVFGVDKNEAELTLKLFAERLEEWERLSPSRYGDFFYNDSEAPLLYPAGRKPQEEWENRSWATPSSMRSVDADCEANVIANYLKSDEGE